MTRSRSELADAVDRLAATSRAVVTETRTAIALYQLSGGDAKVLLRMLAADGWLGVEASDQGGAVGAAEIHDEDAGLTIRAAKPGVPDGVEALLTKVGFETALQRSDLAARVWVHDLRDSFETLSHRFSPWGDDAQFRPGDVPSSPRKVTRVLNNSRFPDDLGRWLLRQPGTEIVGGGALPWRRLAIDQLCRALADEIEPEGTLLFRGPPVTRFKPEPISFLEEPVLHDVQRAASWVFENDRELENRHILLAAEVARATTRGGTLLELAQVTGPALEGARIAYNFGVTQQSRDTLKALADLRRAVGDETVKMAEATRGLAAAIAGAIFVGIGIVVARLTIPQSSTWVPTAAKILALILLLYIGTVIWSGFQHFSLQETLRTEWRTRLYRFLDENEYRRMVTVPVAKAKSAFKLVAIAGAAITVLLVIAVLIIAGSAP